MRYTKIAMAGLAAVMTLNGAAAVFAEDETGTNTQKPAYMEQAEGMTDKGVRTMPEMQMPEDIDMSSLDLPEDFVPFDEAHVPDGKNAPANGELRPIEFDEEGNMLFGQRPEGMPPMMDGERPELPEGEMPAFGEGERPELPEGEMPAFGEGERPELPEGEMPAFGEGERPELPEGEMPAFGEGELPELPGGGQGPQMNGTAPQMDGQNFQSSGQNFQTGGQGPRMNSAGSQGQNV